MIKLLGNLRVKELKQICRDYAISGYSSLRKSEIISLIAKSLTEQNINDILKQKGLIEEDIVSREEVVEVVDTGREIDDRTYLRYLLQAVNVKDLKQICRNFHLRGYSKYSKLDLIEFILDSLAKEEYKRLLYEQELDIISEQIELAIKKIQGKDRETIEEIKIVNPDLNEIEITFKGWNWDITSFLSITEDNIEDPLRDCDCRIGGNMGFCSHFWVGFIFSFKEGFLDLEDWHLTRLPDNFKEMIDSIEISSAEPGKEPQETPKELKLIDTDTDAGTLMELVDSRVTVYQGEITEIEERVSEYEGHETTYYLVDLKNVELGPQIKRKSDFDESELQEFDKLKVRLSENKYEKVDIEVGDNFGCNGTVNKDNFFGFMLKRVTKPTTKPTKPTT
jgi:hypothetical protein